MESLTQVIGRIIESMEDFSSWEEEVHSLSLEASQKLAREFLKAVDDELAKNREKDLTVVGKRKMTLMTKFGCVEVERRLYMDGNGNYRYLLDEAIGLKKGSRISASLSRIALELSSHAPYRFAAKVIKEFTRENISHTTLHNMVAQVGDEKNEEEEQRRVDLFEKGKHPPSKEKKAKRLFIEADGVGIALQRQRKKRCEVKIAVAYEGWESQGNKRFRTLGKTVHLGLCPGEEFWQDFSVSLASRYDLKSTEEFILGGDGAPWIKGEGLIIPFKRFQLDRFHLKRALRIALGPDNEKVRIAYEKACEGDVETVKRILKGEEALSPPEKRKQIVSIRRYITQNRDGLPDWRKGREDAKTLRGMGVIEGNGDKILANRVKKRGMSWTPEGADRIAKVIQLRENDELSGWVRKQSGVQPKEMFKEVITQVKCEFYRDPEQWLRVRMPALYGPCSDECWVSILREISHLPKVV